MKLFFGTEVFINKWVKNIQCVISTCKRFGRCFTLIITMTLENNTLSMREYWLNILYKPFYWPCACKNRFGLCVHHCNSTLQCCKCKCWCVCMYVSAVQPFTTSTVLLNTGCPDCLVSYSKYTIGGSTYSGIQLASKTWDVQTDKINVEEMFSLLP